MTLDESTSADMGHESFHATARSLEQALGHVKLSPTDAGVVQMLVTRPGIDKRVVCRSVTADLTHGILNDTWEIRPCEKMHDSSANPQAQVTIMNSRAALMFAATKDRIPLAGDQIYLDLDLSLDNLPTGTVLEIGKARLEVTAEPHTGCAKFAMRFGREALRLTATSEGRQLRLRGINARVVAAGSMNVGDVASVTRA